MVVMAVMKEERNRAEGGLEASSSGAADRVRIVD